MKLRQLQEVPVIKDVTDYFYGIDARPKIDDGWMHNSYNMDSTNIPTLSSRACLWEGLDHRYGLDVGTFDDLKEIDDVTYTIVGNKLKRFAGAEHTTEYDLSEMSSSNYYKRQLIAFGRDAVVFPDMFYLDYSKGIGEFFNYRIKSGSSPVDITMCTYDGTDINVAYNQSSQPQNPVNGQYWIDTSKDSILKRWNETTDSWETVPTNYIKIRYKGSQLGAIFKEGMTVNFYCENPTQNNVTYVANDTTNTGTAKSLLKDMYEKILVVVKNSGADYIVIEGMLKHAKYSVVNACFENVIPSLNYVFEHGNRMWGCYFGVQRDSETHEGLSGNFENAIYCSALGDYKTWYKYSGTTLDSYSATVGEGGYFTGAGVVNGVPTFFKENAIISVYGNYPANFQVVSKKATGIASGCSRTLAFIDGKAFYQGANGIYVYDGSVPVKISDPIVKLKCSTGNIGAGINGHYVIDAYTLEHPDDDKKTRNVTYIYDIGKRVWNRLVLPERKTVYSIATTPRNIIICDNDQDTQNYELFYDGTRNRREIPLEWMMETGELALKSNTAKTFLEMKKYISQIIVRMNIPEDEAVYFYLMYDDSGEWEHVYTADGGRLKSYTIPIHPRRCDHLRMKMTGRGKADIYSIVKRIEMGSER